ncbi:MAG: hypothetical protein ABR559_09030 [Gemmatimonadota bacterium]
MSRWAVGAFVLLTLAWLAATALSHVIPYGYFVAGALIWWGLLMMTIATGYYLIQEAPAARVSGWLRRDLAVNGVLLVALLFTILDGTTGFRQLGLRGAGWIAFAVAALHPLLVDWPHWKHHQRDPAGSPVPQYVPPACVWIDGMLALLALGGLALL